VAEGEAFEVVLSSRRLCECVLLLCLSFLSFRNFDDTDGWWHLRTGQYIVETGSIPHADIFSATKAGHIWITHEWLSEVFMYLLYRIGGFGLLSITFCLVSVAAFWITYVRCEARPFVAGIFVILGAAAASPMLGARPQVISLLLTSIFLAFQHSYATTGRSTYLWCLVAITAFWVNLHGAFILGPILLLIQIAGLLLDRWLIEESAPNISSHFRGLSLAFAGCLLVVPLNPSGLRLFRYAAETALRKTEQTYLADWASPNFHTLQAQAFALLILVMFGALALTKDRARPSSILALIAFTYLGLQSVRHVPIFALVAIPAVSKHSGLLAREHGFGVSQSVDRQRSRWLLHMNVALAVLLFSFTASRFVSMVRQQSYSESRKFPKAAVEFIKSNRMHGPIFSVYEWGGYLIWHLYPNANVYVDGRPEIYGDEYIAEYVNSYFGGKNWQNPLDRAQIPTVLVRPGTPLASLLRQATDWQKVFEDDVAVLFIRNPDIAAQLSLNGVKDENR
jgi:hypothetical protein